MYSAQPFISGNFNKFRQEFFSQPFKTSMLGRINTNHVDNSFFMGWNGSSTNKITRYSKDDCVIHFFGKHKPYEIKLNNHTFVLPYPQNLDEFICDCKRCNIDLRWNVSIFDDLDPALILSIQDYQNYITDILRKLDKIE